MGRQLERGSGSNNSIDKILFCLFFLYERENPPAVANFRMKLHMELDMIIKDAVKSVLYISIN